MGTELPADWAFSHDDDDTQTDVSTWGDGGSSFCIELVPDSAKIYYDAPASERDSAYQRLAGLATPSSGNDVFSLDIVTNKKWANGRTLTVCFFGGSTTLQQSVKDYASQWMQFANIKFHFVAGRNADIRIAFTGSGGRSGSYIGSDNSLVDRLLPTMNLGLDDNSPPLTIQWATLHEFGHALGCVHEHSQPDHDILWNREAVIKAHRGIWSEEAVEHNIFRKYNPQGVGAAAFNPYSIMLYPIPESWTYDRFSSKRNNTLSVADQAYISEMYPFGPFPTQSSPTKPPPIQPIPTQPPPAPPTPVVVQQIMGYLPPHASSGDIAAIKWSDSTNEQIRIYYQRSDGYIYEGAWSGNRWNSESTKLVKAKPATPITVVLTTSNPIDLRLYYLDDWNKIVEHCFMARGWTRGAVLPSSSIAADTGLAGHGWSDGSGAHINVFYQKSDTIISTISYSVSSGWTAEEDLLWGYKASSMSAIQLDGDIRVYCQGSDTSLTRITPHPHEISVDLMKSYRIPGGTGISAVSWANSQRVYFVDHDSVYEMRNDGKGWITPPGQPTNAKTSPHAKLAAIVRSTDPAKISVYFLESSQNQLTEMAYNGYSWNLSKLPF